jgi:hypothetical protein
LTKKGSVEIKIEIVEIENVEYLEVSVIDKVIKIAYED